jgi:hypothetical protein
MLKSILNAQNLCAKNQQLKKGKPKMNQKPSDIKGMFHALLICAFLILGVPIIINLVYWPDIGVWSMFR